MSTLSDIGTSIAMTHLKRPDKLLDAIQAAKKVYLLVCGKVPFDILRTTSAELPMVSGTRTYSFSSLVPAVAGIVSISMTYSSGQYRRLHRNNARSFDSLRATPSGRPHNYARWGGGIEVHPTPDSSSYTYRVRYWSYPTLEQEVGNTTLVTPPEWDELMEWETLYRMYNQLGEMEKAAALVTPMPMPRQKAPKRTIQFEAAIIPRLWNDLLLTMDQRENVDEDFSINPVVRAYTHV